MKEKIIVKNKEHLKSLIANEIKINGNECDLNHIDTSLITDMEFIFYDSLFNGDISKWNIENVTHMEYMFDNSSIDKPWWAIEDNDKRKLVIDKYNLMKKLDNKFVHKDETNTPKKNKI